MGSTPTWTMFFVLLPVRPSSIIFWRKAPKKAVYQGTNSIRCSIRFVSNLHELAAPLFFLDNFTVLTSARKTSSFCWDAGRSGRKMKRHENFRHVCSLSLWLACPHISRNRVIRTGAICAASGSWHLNMKSPPLIVLMFCCQAIESALTNFTTVQVGR